MSSAQPQLQLLDATAEPDVRGLENAGWISLEFVVVKTNEEA